MAPTDGHMHQARFELLAPDRVKSCWTYWAEGKPGEAATFDFRRVK
jgi:hypothetical protein